MIMQHQKVTVLCDNFNVYEASELESTYSFLFQHVKIGDRQTLITACHSVTEHLYTDVAQIYITTPGESLKNSLTYFLQYYVAILTPLIWKN